MSTFLSSVIWDGVGLLQNVLRGLPSVLDSEETRSTLQAPIEHPPRVQVPVLFIPMMLFSSQGSITLPF